MELIQEIRTSASTTDDIACARVALQSAKHVLVVTGAGISAESGIPTFRGEGGYWRNRHFSELATSEAFTRDPILVWEWYCERRQTVAASMPNNAHRALAEWSKRRTGITLVTQNVDGLHERAGHPDVVRLHGSLWRNRCTHCDAERVETTLAYEVLPRSPCCYALERPAIVWFNENIPFEAFHQGVLGAIQADAVLVVGTSGMVFPAAAFIARAAAYRTPIIDVNLDATNLPATHRLYGRASAILQDLLHP